MMGLRATGSTRGESIARSLQRVTLPKSPISDLFFGIWLSTFVLFLSARGDVVGKH